MGNLFKDFITIFGYTVQTHGVVSVIAILLAYGVALVGMRGTVYEKHMESFIFYAVIGAIIGARFWHVFVFQWPYFSQNPGEILMIWKGGISILGAIIGGLVVLIIYSYKHKLNFFEFADYLAPALILGQAIGRAAELLAGDVFGSPTGGNFGMVYPEGTVAYSYYGSQPLWPADIWESQGNFVIYAILVILSARKLPKGWIFLIYFILYSFQRFMLEFLRGDSPRYFLNLTAGQWTTFWTIIAAILLGAYLLFRQKKLALNEGIMENIGNRDGKGNKGNKGNKDNKNNNGKKNNSSKKGKK
ncbi:prolipoprotein diacylglyceryl transferase [Aquibacillus sp. 3ASR75-11]|uniref:Phosphatidylglycerol--prolipoprotein diacylglyceryl transferase n=1 Tax=Terrihalobacillus insolitus TaxID=2950438 RepID=A0A9X3WU61_9BACI|nr:prolipoprotein diacylglyceryl transferase [Terrihalobacillus insolitus]MDC3425765.1 prolipoprotein diacylglyceryl transferase [Terrihalobacillus insolitus]